MTEPRGTQERTATKPHLSPSTTTDCCRFSRKALIHFRVSHHIGLRAQENQCDRGFDHTPNCKLSMPPMTITTAGIAKLL